MISSIRTERPPMSVVSENVPRRVFGSTTPSPSSGMRCAPPGTAPCRFMAMPPCWAWVTADACATGSRAALAPPAASLALSSAPQPEAAATARARAAPMVRRRARSWGMAFRYPLGAPLLRRLVDPLDVGEGGLLDAGHRDQALLVDRRRRPRVAPLPVRAHRELLQRPPDRARQPRLARVDAEVEVREVLLELVGAPLLDRAVAVGLGAGLGDHDGLARIALAHAVEVVAEQRAVGDLPVGARVPAEVLVDADHVQRRVLGLAAGRRVAGDREADRARRIDRLGELDGAVDVVALHRARAGAELVAGRPHDDRRVVDVRAHRGLQLAGGELAHELLLEVLGLDRVHRDLGPGQHAQLVEALVVIGVQRIMAAQQRRARLAGPLDLLLALGVVDGEALVERILVRAEAAEVQRLAVEHQVAVDDLDGADARLDRVGLQGPALAPARRRRGQRRVVEVRRVGRPRARVLDRDAPRERGELLGTDGG